MCALWLAIPAFADYSITLAWDPNTEPDLQGYKIHYGPTRGNYTNTVNVGNVTNYTVAGLPAGSTFVFVATAYNTSNLESDYSEPVTWSSKLSPPGNFRMISSQIQAAASPLGPWTHYAYLPAIPLPDLDGTRFFRVLLGINRSTE
jgi:hypothetical protein